MVVNLMHPELCEETFGMTILCAIAPPIDGYTEFVHYGINAYQQDQRHLQKIIAQTKLFSTN